MAAVILTALAARNGIFLSEGSHGLPGWQKTAVDALGMLPFTAFAALLLVTSMPRHEPVDRMPARLPLVMSLIALSLVGACFLFPAALVGLSLLIGMLSGGLGG
ncbi:hypothetical protein GCM10027408_00200 [Microbacterium tumbae]